MAIERALITGTKQGKIKGELQNSAQIKEKIDNNNCKFERIY